MTNHKDLDQKRERLMTDLIEASPESKKQSILDERQSGRGLDIRREAKEMARRAGF